MISSVGYATFLRAFQQSLHSASRPTVPLQIGKGLGYGAAFWGLGLPFDSTEQDMCGADCEWQEKSYAYTSWRMSSARAGLAAPMVNCMGCQGWWPGLFPTTEADGAGWWAQLSREGPVLGCVGAYSSDQAMQGHANAEGLVDTIIEAVARHRKFLGAAPFEAVHADVACQRSPVATQICDCMPDFKTFDFDCVASACSDSQGKLDLLACEDPRNMFHMMKHSVKLELHDLCSSCEVDH